jgi:hypothetical protein
MDLTEVGLGAWTGSFWLRIGTGGGLLWIRWWTFGFHKMREIPWLNEDLLASQEGLCFMDCRVGLHYCLLCSQARKGGIFISVLDSTIFRDCSFGITACYGGTARGSNPVGVKIFGTSPDRFWGPPSFLYKGQRVSSGCKAAEAWC